MFDDTPKTYNPEARRRIAAAVHGWETGRVPPGRDGGPAGRGEPQVILIGKPTADVAKGTTGTIQIYRGEVKGSETFTSGDTVQAYARLGAVSSGKWCYVAWVSGGWEILVPEC